MWWLSLIGIAASMLFSKDNYYEGMVRGAAIVGGIWFTVWALKQINFQFWHLLVGVAGLYIAYSDKAKPLVLAPEKPQTPARRPFRPWKGDAEVGAFVKGGAISPDGTHVECDLPAEYRMKNVGGRDGAGLCVFTSIMHAARYQQEPKLWEFQKQMRAEPGGGYPAKVDKMIARYGPGTNYVQHEGGDADFLKLALRTGRMPSVTYCGRDGVYYKSNIAHMVNLAYLDGSRAAILDNNYIGNYLWMTESEFDSRWQGQGGGWAVVLLSPPPPQPPKN